MKRQQNLTDEAMNLLMHNEALRLPQRMIISGFMESHIKTFHDKSKLCDCAIKSPEHTVGYHEAISRA